MSAVIGKKGFQKGQSPNPKGRPKGAVNDSTKRFTLIRNMAAQDYEKAYNLLWEAMEAKESWAFHLYFKTFVPRETAQEMVSIEHKSDTVKGQMRELVEGINQFTTYTQENLLKTLDTLVKVQNSEAIEDEQSIYSPRNSEAMAEELRAIERVIDHMERNNMTSTKEFLLH